MTQFYYKVTDPARIAALDKYKADSKAAREEAEAFVKQFQQPGQTVTVDMYSGHFRFAGAKFKPPMPNDTWTVPARDHDWQRPRGKPTTKGMTAEQKEEHAKLVARWADGPKGTASLDELYKSLIGVENDFMMAGNIRRAADGSLLVMCNRQAIKADGITELLGSEYEAAQKTATEN